MPNPSPPTPTGLTYDRYESIFAGSEPPFAFVDMDAVSANAEELAAAGRAGQDRR